jgi:hypothetical protein
MLRQVFASAAAYYRRHFSKGSLLALRVIVIGLMLGRLVRDAGMLMLPQNMARRQRLRENMLVWPYILSDARSHWNHND